MSSKIPSKSELASALAKVPAGADILRAVSGRRPASDFRVTVARPDVLRVVFVGYSTGRTTETEALQDFADAAVRLGYRAVRASDRCAVEVTATPLGESRAPREEDRFGWDRADMAEMLAGRSDRWDRVAS